MAPTEGTYVCRGFLGGALGDSRQVGAAGGQRAELWPLVPTSLGFVNFVLHLFSCPGCEIASDR